MGLLWRRFAPRPVKKARRALHPGRVVVRAATPKPIKTIRRATFGVVHPLEAAESAIINSIVRAPKRSRGAGQSSTSWENVIGRAVFVYVCHSYGMEFAHLNMDSALRPHNDRFERLAGLGKASLRSQ